MVARRTVWTISLRTFLPIAAGVSFAALCVAGTRQNHVIDIPEWSHSVGNTVRWGEEPVDIGTPGDVLLLALNLPALIALLPLSPLAYWIESEIVLRIAWGLASVGQWYLIGRYFDIRRGLVARSEWNVKLSLKKVVFIAAMVAGAIALGMGGFSIAVGHSSPWAFVWDTGFVFWGMVFLIVALRWRASSAWSKDRIDSLGLSSAALCIVGEISPIALTDADFGEQKAQSGEKVSTVEARLLGLLRLLRSNACAS